MKQFFSIEKELDTTSARAGILHTDHGIIKTPFFMPVGTYGAVKTQSAFDIRNHGSDILLSNDLDTLCGVLISPSLLGSSPISSKSSLVISLILSIYSFSSP